MARKIFVNYRRADSLKDAFLITARLKDRYGARNVFLDENLSGGQVFPQVLERRLVQCSVMLTVIGSEWLNISGDDGAHRLASKDDWVRHEIRRALELKIPLVPVLINGATIPSKSALPADIARLTDHHAVSVRTADHGFRGDMAVLIEAIDRIRGRVHWPAVGAVATAVLMVGWVGAYQLGVPVWVPWSPSVSQQNSSDASKKAAAKLALDAAAANQIAAAEATARKKAEDDALATAHAKAEEAEASRQRLAAAEVKRLALLAAKEKEDREAREKAEREAATKKAELAKLALDAAAAKQIAAAEATARKKAEDDALATAQAKAEEVEASRQRLAAAEAKRLALLAAKEKEDREAREKAEAEVRARLAAEAERQKSAALKAVEGRKHSGEARPKKASLKPNQPSTQAVGPLGRVPPAKPTRPANLAAYSLGIWPVKSITEGQTVSKNTPFGRLTCTSNGYGTPRTCSLR